MISDTPREAAEKIIQQGDIGDWDRPATIIVFGEHIPVSRDGVQARIDRLRRAVQNWLEDAEAKHK